MENRKIRAKETEPHALALDDDDLQPVNAAGVPVKVLLTLNDIQQPEPGDSAHSKEQA